MKKSEIKEGINLIINSIKTVRENIDEILEGYEKVKEHLEEIEGLEFEYEIDTGIDVETVLNDTIRSCIDSSDDIETMHDSFEELYDKLSEWQEEVGEKKFEEIEELYINPLADIKDIFEIDSIECEEDLESQLSDMIIALEEMEI